MKKDRILARLDIYAEKFVDWFIKFDYEKSLNVKSIFETILRTIKGFGFIFRAKGQTTIIK